MPDLNTIQAEQSVVGSILIDSSCFRDVLGAISADDFRIKQNRDIFETVYEMYAAGSAIDVVTIENEMVRRGVHTETTHSYITELMQITPTAANVMCYCSIVREAARRRVLESIADDMSSAAYLGQDADTILSDAASKLEQLGRSARSPIVSSRDAMLRWNDWVNLQDGNPDYALVRTGYATLDKQLGGGFFKTGFYVIGGRPGMGKTTTALNIAERISFNNKRVLFLSLEMSLEQIVAKRLALLSGVSYTALYTGRLSDRDYSALSKPRAHILSSRFDTIVDGVSTVADLAVQLRLLHDVDIVFVDYMGIIEPPEDDRQKPKYEQMSNISKALKALAKSSNIPVVALSQLNRDSTKNGDKRPNLTDLRDSGAIEQDADGVIFVHRPSYYKEGADQTEIELIVAKNRHADTGTVTLKWNADSGCITETDYEQEGLS